MQSDSEIGLGVIGLGGFGQFALQHFLQVPGVRLRAVGGTTRAEATHLADRFGATASASPQAVYDHPGVDWVYINTPPFLHAKQSLAAIAAGKNVLVEKPMTCSVADARAVLEAAKAGGVRVVTNLMQRYNPIIGAVKSIIDEGLMGEPLAFSLANHAVDEGLPPEHWFWDAEKSGGIFIEHGVHFFDVASHWFGDGEVISAGAATRPAVDGDPATAVEDQVWCDVRFRSPAGRSPVVAHFYHAFNQSSRTERQRWSLTLERGHIELSGWIPIEATVEAIVDESICRQLVQRLPGSTLRVIESYPPGDRTRRGHGRMHESYQKVRLDWRHESPKSSVYGGLLVDLLRDQVLCGDTGPAVVQTADGFKSLIMAEKATQIAAQRQ